MWGNLAKQSCLRKFKNLSESQSCLSAVPVVATPHGLSFSRNAKPIEAQIHVNSGKSEFGSSRVTWFRGKCNGKSLENSIFSGIFRSLGDTKGYASTADAALSTSEEEIDDMQELLEEISKETDDKGSRKRMVPGMGNGKYHLLRRRQIKIETEAWEEAAKEYQELLTDMCEQKLAPNLPYVKSLFLGWFEPLRDAIAAEHVLCEEGKCRGAYAPYFNQLPADMMAVITMHKMIALLMTGGCTGSGRFTTGSGQVTGSARVLQAAISIGEAIEHEARIHRFLNKVKRKIALNKTSEEGPDHEANERERLRRKVNNLLKQKKVHEVRKIVRQHDGVRPWGQDTQLKVGSRLVQILMETAYIQPPVDQSDDGPPDIRPAFVHTLKSQDTVNGTRRYGVIECDPLVLKGMERTARHMVIPYMPMLIPPLKWTGYERGAYLFLRSYVMRTHGARQQREAIKRAPKGQLSPVFQALDYLGSTKWRVNKRILGIVDRIWTSGGCIADLVDRQDVPLPEEPDTEDEAERKKWRWKVKNVKKENSERHSQRCDIELKLAVARKMKDEEGFYYPHNLDFRGRAYPMHPYLNHLGSDLCRGILEFAEGRPLGKAGLHWLKIHLANLYGGGVDKLSYEGRVSFTEKHLEDIFDSADRPLDGRRWWLSAEDPLQCLATCMNLSEALRSPYPETVISHMPVHQDGSCNGLQHYAALGRDTLGAAAVNLVAGDKPADVYSGIAARVREIIKRDTAADPAINPTAKHARLLINQVDRKLVKQTVMTSVYGVTYIGARDQMKKRLKERNAIEDDNELFGCACYAARVTLTALEEMFEAARSIMSWLGDCAKIIAKEENQPVRWTTPLGLPVVQPYRLRGRHLVKTSLQAFTLQRDTDKVMVKRQKTAFPPNFVHSLDGSHMMMTALACSQAGLQFAGVHDSYWTHACDVDQMNKILREKFVELYETPILENLLLDFQKSFPNLKFPPLPGRGDFDLHEVRDSVYFFN